MADVTTIDLYEVTMAMSYLRERMSGPATFSLFVRDLLREWWSRRVRRGRLGPLRRADRHLRRRHPRRCLGRRPLPGLRLQNGGVRRTAGDEALLREGHGTRPQTGSAAPATPM